MKTGKHLLTTFSVLLIAALLVACVSPAVAPAATTVPTPLAVAWSTFPAGLWSWVDQAHPEQLKTMLGMNPMGRMATPQRIATAAVFLVSPVSSFTFGVNLVIDGVATDRVNY